MFPTFTNKIILADIEKNTILSNRHEHMGSPHAVMKHTNLCLCSIEADWKNTFI